ncbi:MAG: cob(I)yrinic acid a,c-diamide adenosyltransferase [Pseudomonadota bacterium]
MKHRIHQITTKTGDGGDTALNAETRVRKSTTVIELLGLLDELNARIGWVKCALLAEDTVLTASFNRIQNELFHLGGEVSFPEYSGVSKDMVLALEIEIRDLADKLGPLRDFIIPGADEISARCHLARTACRSCERIWVKWQDEVQDREESFGQIYLNRLSDWLFAVARMLGQRVNCEENMWDKNPSISHSAQQISGPKSS